MGKEKTMLSKAEKKILIGIAYRLYLAEMYLAQKATETVMTKCDNCNTLTERKTGDLLKDYETQKSLHQLAKSVELLEPELWNKWKKEDIDSVQMVKEIVVYLTGVDMWDEKHIEQEVKQESAQSDAKDAIQVDDLMDKGKITTARTLPKGDAEANLKKIRRNK